jgi:uncharacterized protein YhbP (UPF0306 family)
VTNDSEQAARAKAREFCDSVSTLTLATSNADSPWAAAVFFAADSKFNFYFVSDHRTRHGRDMAVNEQVAATIYPDCNSWHDVAGLQLRGRVSIVEGLERARALALYFKKFPQIDALFASPQGEHEETIAARLKAANFYKISPQMIRVIDNAQGFGWREEFAP